MDSRVYVINAVFGENIFMKFKSWNQYRKSIKYKQKLFHRKLQLEMFKFNGKIHRYSMRKNYESQIYANIHP